jgi:indolepyruvate ferredoxin oxidoreductase beta subunit
MTDGRFDSDRILDAARDLSLRTILFDANEAARTSGSPINAILFGALVSSRVLPVDRACAEAAITQAGKAADSNLRGFAFGFEQAFSPPPPARAAPAETPAAAFPGLPVTDFPQPTQEIIAHGVERLMDYQGRSYAQVYLDRLAPISHIERDAGNLDFALTRATGRYLALWMSYEDVIRVADLKTRAGRRSRIRREVRAKNSDIVRVADFLKPGLEEFCSVLPAGLGRSIYRFAHKRGWQNRFNVGMHIRSTTVTGFLLLRLLAGLRWWRPYTWRFREEQVRIQKWIDAIMRAAPQYPALAREIAACGQIMKGYGDTHARAVRNFDLIAAAYFDSLSATTVGEIQAARTAALTDPEGQSLAAELAKGSCVTKPRSNFAAAAE